MTHYYLMPHPPVMIPTVGGGREKEIQRTIDAASLVKQKIKNDEIETLLVITPHGPVFQDAVAIVNETQLSGDLAKFGIYNESLTYQIDQELTHLIIETLEMNQLPVVPLTHLESIKYRFDLELDHGAYVPLYFIGDPLKHQIVHLTYGLLSSIELYQIGMKISEAIGATGKKVAIIASGDLSHCLTKDGPYPFHPSGKEFDEQLISLLKQGKVENLFNLSNNLVKEAAECGLRSLYILLGCMDGFNVLGNVLSYEGPFGVGYGVVEFTIEAGESRFEKIKTIMLDKHKYRLENGNIFTKLVRENLASFFYNGRELEISEITDKELLEMRKGVFVSLKKAGVLRGCIGTFLPTTSSVADEIIHNSLAAALNDPRFPPVQKEELPYLDISVDLLETPTPCTREALDPMRFGVIVSKGQKKGLLLPMLDGINTVEQQLEVVLQKAGIKEEEHYEIERFEVTRYSEV